MTNKQSHQEESRGWVLIYKKILNWEWYDDANVFRLFLHCLLKANWADKKWHGQIIQRGAFITSLNNLAKELKLGVQQIRTALDKLKVTKEITIKTTTQYTKILVNNYDKYQPDIKGNNKRITNEQQTNNKRITTTNKYNKYNNNNNNISSKKKKNIKKRKYSSYTEKYVETFNHLFANKHGDRHYRSTSKRKKKMKTRLQTYEFEEIMKALKNLSHSDWAHGKNDRDWEATPDYLLHNDERVDKWLNRKPEKKESKYELVK